MKIQIIQHSAADQSASVGEILDLLGHHVSTVRIDRGDPIPGEVDCDALMMFGGAISLTGGDQPAWVAMERDLIRHYVDQGQRVLGICLGSQLLASALGAPIQRNPLPEVGWHEVSRLKDGATTGIARRLSPKLHVFQWHQDTFGIPDGATRLYESEACHNQAFAMDDRVFGFQFHFEASERTVKTFLAVSRLWRQDSPFVQCESEIRQGIETYLREQQAELKSFLMAFCPPDFPHSGRA